MQVFHTAGEPPNRGKIILANIGSIQKSRAALKKADRTKKRRAKVDLNMCVNAPSARLFSRPDCLNQAAPSRLSNSVFSYQKFLGFPTTIRPARRSHRIHPRHSRFDVIGHVLQGGHNLITGHFYFALTSPLFSLQSLPRVLHRRYPLIRLEVGIMQRPPSC